VKHYRFATPDGEGVIEVSGALTNEQLNKLFALGYYAIGPQEAKRIISKLYAKDIRAVRNTPEQEEAARLSDLMMKGDEDQ
jgi:hypothetical protein